MPTLQYDGLITIATGSSRRSASWKTKEMLWSEFVDKLGRVTRTASICVLYPSKSESAFSRLSFRTSSPASRKAIASAKRESTCKSSSSAAGVFLTAGASESPRTASSGESSLTISAMRYGALTR